MKTLYSYIKDTTTPLYDGHIHLFSHRGSIVGKIPHENFENMKMVGFTDIEFADIEEYDFVKLYDQFIKDNYDKDKHILLATGTNINDISEIFNKHKKCIKGFGELKCYDTYRGAPVKYKKISLVRDVVKFSSKNGCLPVYIHWEINDNKDVEKIESVLRSYPQVPVVLCHCGINKENGDYAYNTVRRLSLMYGNLWLDVSYTGLDFFVINPMKLLNLPTDRIILGSDLNNRIYDDDHDFDKEYNKIMSKIGIIRKTINTDNNLKKLFNIKES